MPIRPDPDSFIFTFGWNEDRSGSVKKMPTLPDPDSFIFTSLEMDTDPDPAKRCLSYLTRILLSLHRLKWTQIRILQNWCRSIRIQIRIHGTGSQQLKDFPWFSMLRESDGKRWWRWFRFRCSAVGQIGAGFSSRWTFSSSLCVWLSFSRPG